VIRRPAPRFCSDHLILACGEVFLVKRFNAGVYRQDKFVRSNSLFDLHYAASRAINWQIKVGRKN